MQDLDILKEHLDRMTQELMEAKKIALKLKTVDRKKADRAWKNLMLASQEISRRWEGASAVEEVELQREKKWMVSRGWFQDGL